MTLQKSCTFILDYGHYEQLKTGKTGWDCQELEVIQQINWMMDIYVRIKYGNKQAAMWFSFTCDSSIHLQCSLYMLQFMTTSAYNGSMTATQSCQTDTQTDKHKDGRTDGRTDKDGRTDRQTDSIKIWKNTDFQKLLKIKVPVMYCGDNRNSKRWVFFPVTAYFTLLHIFH